MSKDCKLYTLGDVANENSRPSRGKPSSKMDEACASRMFLTCARDGSVSVRYIKQHTGHDPANTGELQHLRLTSSIRRQITMQLLNRVDAKSIVRSLNGSLRNRNEREDNVLV